MTGDVCGSCGEVADCSFDWHADVDRPSNIPDGPICVACHESLCRFAGDDDHPLEGEAPPHPTSTEAITGLIAMTRRGLR